VMLSRIEDVDRPSPRCSMEDPVVPPLAMNHLSHRKERTCRVADPDCCPVPLCPLRMGEVVDLENAVQKTLHRSGRNCDSIHHCLCHLDCGDSYLQVSNSCNGENAGITVQVNDTRSFSYISR
jgi:hypothetical protein